MEETISTEITLMIAMISIIIPLFIFIIIFYVYRFILREVKNTGRDNNQKLSQQDIDYIEIMDMNNPNYKKISESSVMFKSNDFYYDQSYFYIVNNEGLMAKYSLSKIIEIKSTYTKVANRRIWQVAIIDGEKEFVFRFRHNHTLWNKNFENFLFLMKQISPEVVKSKWNIWTR